MDKLPLEIHDNSKPPEPQKRSKSETVLEGIIDILMKGNGVDSVKYRSRDIKFFLDYNGKGRVVLYSACDGKVGSIRLPNYILNKVVDHYRITV